MDWFLFALYLLIWWIWLWSGLRIFWYFNILDKPWKDVPERKPVPTLQWVVLIFLFIVLLIIAKVKLDISFGRDFLWLFIWGAIIALVAIIDEFGYLIHKKYAIPARVRFAIQIMVAVVARNFSWIWIEVIHFPWVMQFELSSFTSLLATILRFSLFINAINRFDGIYWLATWVSSIWYLTIFLLITFIVFPNFEFMSLERSELLVRVQIVSLILFVLWFLATIMEFKPRGLMRDVWTMFLWFGLGYLALLGGAKIGTLIVVLWLPIFDAVWVIVDRLRRNKNPFKWDYSHLHYRLLALGRNRNEIRVWIWIWSLFFMMIMLLLWIDWFAKMIVFFAMAALFFGLNIYLFWVKKKSTTLVVPS